MLESTDPEVLHDPYALIFQSAYETSEGTLDPTRAHKAAGDPAFNIEVASCGLCQAKRLAEDEREKSARELTQAED